MQRSRIGFPLQFDPRARSVCLGIVRLDRERALQCRLCVSVALKQYVAVRYLLQRENVTRVEIICALEAAQRLFIFALATLDVTPQLKDARLVRQTQACN